MPGESGYNPRAEHDDSLIKGNTWLTRWIARLISAVTPKCREVTRLISQGMERSLPLHVRLRLRLHYLWCCYCRRYAYQLHDIQTVMQKFPENAGSASSAKLSPEARQRIEAAIRDALSK
jgi:hypothetical protein